MVKRAEEKKLEASRKALCEEESRSSVRRIQQSTLVRFAYIDHDMYITAYRS